MIIVDSCIVLFDFDCIMHLKKSHYIANNVSSRISATTFGDLPDWWYQITRIYRKCNGALVLNPCAWYQQKYVCKINHANIPGAESLYVFEIEQ